MSGQPSVGIIGLGMMGAALTRRLLSDGFSVTVRAWPSSPVAELVAAGAVAVEEPAALAERAEIVITSLPDADAVREVLLGQAGLAAAARPGTVVVDTSTISPGAARALAADLATHSIGYLDAPVSGGPAACESGTLSIMVGGAAEELGLARPVLDAIGSQVAHLGSSGAGQICKACNQLAVISTLEVVAETLALASASGLDAAAVREALLGGYAASRVLDLHGQRMIERNFEPGGKARFNLKDIDIIAELASEAEVTLPAFGVAAEQLTRLIDAGGADLDNAAIYAMIAPDQTGTVA